MYLSPLKVRMKQSDVIENEAGEIGDNLDIMLFLVLCRIVHKLMI